MTEIAPGIHSLGQTMGGHVHAFLLIDDDGLTLIDTLFDTDAHRVLEAIRALGHTSQDLKRIVLTHGHRSHLGGLAALKAASGATIYAHEWEEDIIAGNRKAQPVTLVPMWPLTTYARVYPLQLGLALGIGKHPPCPVDKPPSGWRPRRTARGASRARPFARSPRVLVAGAPRALRRRRDRHLAGLRRRLVGVQPQRATAPGLARPDGGTRRRGAGRRSW